MRAGSLTNLGVGVDYNIASDYDKVLVVAGLAEEIEALAPYSSQIGEIVANLPDVLTIQQAIDVLNNLSVVVTTLEPGAVTTSELVGTEIRLGIPRGEQGLQGIVGPKGDKGDKGDTGLTGAQGPIGLTGPQGPRGLRGNDGVDGVGVEITSILNNPNKSLTINFSDGTQHTTAPLKGEDGTSITVTNVVNNPNGTMQINFSDGTSHTTANLTGPRGFKGDTGDHVHHISYVRSKDSLGNEVGPVTPGQPGFDDTYAMWLSQEELPETYIGEFVIHNGQEAFDYAVAGGYTGTQADFYLTLANIQYYYNQVLADAGDVREKTLQVEEDALQVAEDRLVVEDARDVAVEAKDTAVLSSEIVQSIFLGPKESDPTVDNEGNPLVVGVMYYNTVAGTLRIWDGAVWSLGAFSVAGAVTMVNGRDGAVELTKTDVGLENVQNVDTTNATNISSGTLNTSRLADSGVVAGTYRSVTTDSKGRITVGTNPTTVAEYGITDAYTKTEVQETLPAVGLDTTNTVAPTRPGQIKWNQNEGTADLVLNNGVTLQVGQENTRLVRNGTLDVIPNMTVCMFDGTLGSSGRIKVAPFTGLFDQAHYIYGIATQSINAGEDGYITIDGKVRNVNTTGAAVGETWLDGDILYVKPNNAGHLTKVVPADDELKMPIASVIHAHVNGTLEVRVLALNENMIAKRANKWTTARTVALSGDVAGSTSIDGSANVTITTTVQPNSVELGTNTTGNYMVNVAAGSGISVSHTQGEGSTATITNSAPNVTTNITTTHTSTNVVVNSSDGTDGTINSATQTLAGVMSAADKTKLDGIEAGATGDQTASEILTLLKTVDGSGSGLEAETATKLSTARTIALTGDVTGTVNFDGSANVSITTTVSDDSHNHVISNVDGLQAALDSKAPLESPTFTGVPSAPTAAVTTNTTQLATTAFVNAEIANDAVPRVASTDNAIVRFDGLTGVVQNSDVIIGDDGNLLLTSGTGALGYGVGAGGSVTQLTSKSTAVTLNKPSGQITMHNEALVGGGQVTFNLNNSLLNITSNLLINTRAGTSLRAYRLGVEQIGNGVAIITLTNTSGTTLSQNVLLKFDIIQGATA